MLLLPHLTNFLTSIQSYAKAEAKKHTVLGLKIHVSLNTQMLKKLAQLDPPHTDSRMPSIRESHISHQGVTALEQAETKCLNFL